jgi:hypothetical protein
MRPESDRDAPGSAGGISRARRHPTGGALDVKRGLTSVDSLCYKSRDESDLVGANTGEAL